MQHNPNAQHTHTHHTAHTPQSRFSLAPHLLSPAGNGFTVEDEDVEEGVEEEDAVGRDGRDVQQHCRVFGLV